MASVLAKLGLSESESGPSLRLRATVFGRREEVRPV